MFRAVEDLGKRVERSISALGARWGFVAEEVFRDFMRDVLSQLVPGARVEKWIWYDRDGVVRGYPSWIEVDLVISRDGVHYLVEVKSSVSDGDIVLLSKVARLYREVTGVEARPMIVTFFARKEAKDAAEKLGVKLYVHSDVVGAVF